MSQYASMWNLRAPSAAPVAPDRAQLVQRFNEIDRDRSGSITADELSNAVRERGYGFKPETVRLLIRMFDTMNVQRLNFEQFVALNEFILQHRNTFVSLDSSRTGRVPYGLIRQAIQSGGGFQLAESTWATLLPRFDRQQSGSYSFDSYVDLSVYLHICSNIFNWKDQDRDGYISLNLEDFIYMSSFTK